MIKICAPCLSSLCSLRIGIYVLFGTVLLQEVLEFGELPLQARRSAQTSPWGRTTTQSLPT